MEQTAARLFAPLLSVGAEFVNSFKRSTEDTIVCDVPFHMLQDVRCECSVCPSQPSCVFMCDINCPYVSRVFGIGHDCFVWFTADIIEGRLFFTKTDHDQRSIYVCSCLCEVPVVRCVDRFL
jgi:hypothetical protein